MILPPTSAIMPRPNWAGLPVIDRSVATTPEVRSPSSVSVRVTVAVTVTASVALLPPASERDEQKLSRAGPGSDAPRHFVPVDVWHPEVEDGRVRPEGLQRVERGATAVRDGHDRAQRTQKLSQHIRRIGVVVHDQDSTRRKVHPALRLTARLHIFSEPRQCTGIPVSCGGGARQRR